MSAGGDLEPGTVGDTDAEHVQCSIAISLKRLADAVVGSEQRTGIHALIWQIEQRLGSQS